MTALAFDISSGGISAALFNPGLEITSRAEIAWHFKADESGAATLSIEMILDQFKDVLRDLKGVETADAIGIGCFMHNCVLLDSADKPLTPVFTWLDRRGEEGVSYVRNRLGGRFHALTGCRYHPAFPVFKLAALSLRDSKLIAQANRAVSAKSFLIHRLTGVWIEDYGMASSSGLYNLKENCWDSSLLALAGLKSSQVPPVTSRNEIVGRVTHKAAGEFGLAEGTPVINGSGDGFFASVGSDSEAPSRICVTLGTSAAARQSVSEAVLDSSAGTFCYKADEAKFLLGCAGNNGGNVLDWGRSVFGDLNPKAVEDIPIFIPLLHGERSPEWDPGLKGSFRDLTSHHGSAEMGRSVLEGVIFNLQFFVEIIEKTSRVQASEIVLSGNGFLEGAAASTLAAIAGVSVLKPAAPGIASLRGAAVSVFRALGKDVPPLQTSKVAPLNDPRISARYRRYKELRRTI